MMWSEVRCARRVHPAWGLESGNRQEEQGGETPNTCNARMNGQHCCAKEEGVQRSEVTLHISLHAFLAARSKDAMCQCTASTV